MASQDSQSFRWHYDSLDDRNFEIRGRTLFFVIVLFSVVLLVTLLFLYTRWICRSPPVLPVSGDSAFRAPSAAGTRGLDPATIGSFPIVLHRPSAATINEVECCICLGIFSEGEKIKVLPNCNHFYHSVCVDKWLTSQSSCPLCRAPLRPDSPV